MATSLNPKKEVIEPVPVVDRERLEDVYDELKRMTVRLDPNPIALGPVRFQNRIAKVRSMLTRVEQIFLQASEDLHWYTRATRSKRLLYELERRDLMVNDPKCRMGRSQGEREDLANNKLRPQIEEIEDLAARAEDLEILMAAIKSRRTDLKDSQGRMRDQMKLIEHDLGMGARWGKAAPDTDTDASLNDINSLLSSVDDSVDFPDEDDDAEAAEEEETVEEETDEEIVVEDDHDDPAPVAGNVIEFHAADLDVEEDVVEESADGESDDEESEDPSYDDIEEPLIPDEDAEGDLPEDDHSSEETDQFLDDLDPTPPEAEASEHPDEGSIEDLISSLADD